MTEATQPTGDPGRWIRAALVILPVGTIFLGIASFGIWQWKKDQAADRSFRYAMALRRPISLEEIQRHAGILREALIKQDRLLSIPAYLESTMGAENMGYSVRRTRLGNDMSVVDAELTGKKRPREVVMALALYDGDPTRFEGTSQAIADLLSIAHEATGESVARSLRFVVIPNTPTAMEEVKTALRRDDERVMRLVVLGGPSAETMTKLRDTFETSKMGTEVMENARTVSAQETLQSAHELKALLLHAAERL